MFRRENNSPKSPLTVIVVVVVVLLLLFSGRISCELTEESLTVGASLAGSVTVAREDMESVQLISELEPGSRRVAASSFLTECGRYKNSVYGSYRLYRHKSVDCAIELRHSGGEVLVFNLETEEQTRSMLDRLEAMIEN